MYKYGRRINATCRLRCPRHLLNRVPKLLFLRLFTEDIRTFSMEAIEQTWDGTGVADAEARCTSTIARNGDLLYRMYLEIEGTPKTTIQNLTAASIVNVDLEIGGQNHRQTKWSMDECMVPFNTTESAFGAHVGVSDGNQSEGNSIFRICQVWVEHILIKLIVINIGYHYNFGFVEMLD